MVDVVVVTEKGSTIPLEFEDIYAAGSAMHTLAHSVVGGCAFTVSFKKEESKSRFINPEEMKAVPAEELASLEELLQEEKRC